MNPGRKDIEMKVCKECGTLYERGMLSRQGYCPQCSLSRLDSATRQLKEKSGPVWDRYVRNKRLADALIEDARKRGTVNG